MCLSHESSNQSLGLVKTLLFLEGEVKKYLFLFPNSRASGSSAIVKSSEQIGPGKAAGFAAGSGVSCGAGSGEVPEQVSAGSSEQAPEQVRSRGPEQVLVEEFAEEAPDLPEQVLVDILGRLPGHFALAAPQRGA